MATDTETVLPDEQGAELAALMQQAEGGTPAPGGAVQEAAPPAGPELADEIQGTILMVAEILKPALPNVAALYQPDVAEAVGAAVAALCKKHGWLQDGLMGEWREEIACLMICGPLAWATYGAAKDDMAALRARKIKAEPAHQVATQPPPAPETQTGTQTQTGLAFGEVQPA